MSSSLACELWDLTGLELPPSSFASNLKERYFSPSSPMLVHDDTQYSVPSMFTSPFMEGCLSVVLFLFLRKDPLLGFGIGNPFRLGGSVLDNALDGISGLRNTVPQNQLLRSG